MKDLFIFHRREKQSLERYLKEVPTVEEHQKLNKTISFNHMDVTYLLRAEVPVMSRKFPSQGLNKPFNLRGPRNQNSRKNPKLRCAKYVKINSVIGKNC